MKFDSKEFIKQTKEMCEENGFKVEVYVPTVNKEDVEHHSKVLAAPLVSTKGETNTFTIALACIALEKTIDILKKKHDDAKECYEFLKRTTRVGEDFDL